MSHEEDPSSERPLPRRAAASADAPEAEPASSPRHARRAVKSGASMSGAVGRTASSTLLPGSGLWTTKYRRQGLAISGVVVAILAALAITIAAKPEALRDLAVSPTFLNVVTMILVVGAILWVTNITVTHLLVRPRQPTQAQRIGGGILVGALSLLVALPTFIAAAYVRTSADVVTQIFQSRKSQTRPTLGPDPWKTKPRVNILLLGSDGNRVRDTYNGGIRTDTMILASIETATGNTVLIQLPRNMARAQFPAGSALAERYPDGFYNGNGDDAEYMLNAIYTNVPNAHPDLFTDTDYAGADALKLAFAGTTGVVPDYFMMINIDGIQTLINAMGGVTVNINERLGIGGNDYEPPLGYLEPGPDQHLDGYHAMWYARSRHTSVGGDFSRMARQTCLIQAIVEQANPQTMLTKYEAIASSAKNIVLTDIPQDMLSPMVDLAFRVKDAKINRVLFVQGQDGFVTYDPDFDLMRRRIQLAIGRNEAGTSASPSASTPASPATARATTPAATTPAATNESRPPSDKSASSEEPTAGPSAQPSVDVEPVKDQCAYHPVDPDNSPPKR